MLIDSETVKRIAFLARLRVDKDKIEETKDEFNKILDWMEQLNNIDIQDVVPLVSVNDTTLRMRDDIVCSGHNKEAILKNAPMAEYDYFAVPKVVE